MAKYGLSQVDLNLRVQLALIGLSGKPERDIAALLRSGQPIEPQTREQLADALEGKDSVGLSLKATNRRAAQRTRQLRNRIADLRIGRRVLEVIEELGIGYTTAIKKVSDETGIGLKSMEKHVELARDIDKWSTSIKKSDPERYDHLSDVELEVAFLYAVVTKQEPTQCVRSSLPVLCQLMRYLDRLHEDAAGIFSRGLLL